MRIIIMVILGMVGCTHQEKCIPHRGEQKPGACEKVKSLSNGRTVR